MKYRLSAFAVVIVACALFLVPASSLAETITILNEDFESSPYVFTTNLKTYNPAYHTSGVFLKSSGNHTWLLTMGNGTTIGYRALECYTENFSSYVFPSNAINITYEADIWIVNNNQMPDQVFYGMNFGYQDRIMRLRFSWDSKEILYQWQTGNTSVPLPQAFTYGRWYSVKIVYHTSSKTCDIYIDDIIQSLGFSTVQWTDNNVSVNGHNPLIKFNLVTKTTNVPLVLNNPFRVNFDNIKVYYTQEAPVTGDNSRIVLWISILLISVTVVILLIRIIKKRHTSANH